MSRVSNMKNVIGVSPCGVGLTQIQRPLCPLSPLSSEQRCVKLGLATTGHGGWTTEDGCDERMPA